MNPARTLLIVPPNDEEAYLIAEIGERLGMQVYRSSQPHGARLEKEPGVCAFIKKSSADTVVVVEMPGLKTEGEIRRLGRHLVIIDHHNYTDLDRAHALDGTPLPSSLEQFLRLFDVTDEQLDRFGYVPRFVRAVGLWDAGYIWALFDAGFSREDMEKFLVFKDEIALRVGAAEVAPHNKEMAKGAWEQRETFGDFLIVTSLDPIAQIRSNVSRLAAMEFWRPTPMIISERGGKRLYVQETDHALDLFHHFGGFTFGTDRNWGYDNDTEKVSCTLSDVKTFLYDTRKTHDAGI
ncbi:hypothetical protein HYW18_00720 [Candidatus Uhrbacteria bacterium]|nr:hypothetical protein [Candidatus Uhrbacteria bacterium]